MVYKIIASFFGIGFIKKGAGTVAAFIGCALLYTSMHFLLYSNNRLLFFSVIVLIIGVITSKEAERSWGKDSNKIVIDEVLGMMISMVFLPINFKTLAAGFILFRFFDIAKPLGIRRFENLKNGWGVMMDDVIAGIYSNIIIQVLLAMEVL